MADRKEAVAFVRERIYENRNNHDGVIDAKLIKEMLKENVDLEEPYDGFFKDQYISQIVDGTLNEESCRSVPRLKDAEGKTLQIFIDTETCDNVVYFEKVVSKLNGMVANCEDMCENLANTLRLIEAKEKMQKRIDGQYELLLEKDGTYGGLVEFSKITELLEAAFEK